MQLASAFVMYEKEGICSLYKKKNKDIRQEANQEKKSQKINR